MRPLLLGLYNPKNLLDNVTKAQLSRLCPLNSLVAGSNPAAATFFVIISLSARLAI